MAKIKLGEFLVSEGLINAYQLELALEHQKRWDKRLGQSLISLNFIQEKAFYQALSRLLQIPIIDFSQLNPNSITSQILQTIPLEMASKHRAVPVSIQEMRKKTRLFVATSDPLNYEVLKEIRFKSPLPLFVMIAPDEDIEWFIQKFYRKASTPKNYVSVVQMKRIGQKSDQIELVDGIFEDSLFDSNTKTRDPKRE